jgi:hypothetical protein
MTRARQLIAGKEGCSGHERGPGPFHICFHREQKAGQFWEQKRGSFRVTFFALVFERLLPLEQLTNTPESEQE